MIDIFKLKAPTPMADMIKLAAQAAREASVERQSFAPPASALRRPPETDKALVAAVLAGALIQARAVTDAPITRASEAMAVWQEVLSKLGRSD